MRRQWAAGAGLRLTYRRHEAGKLLRESEARYRAVVEDQEELIRRFKPDYTLTFVNRAFCRYFGQTAEALLGQSFMKLIPCEDHEGVRCQMESLSPDNPVAVAERRFAMPHGEVRWQEWVNRAIFDQHGNIVEYQSVGRDITSQKKVEQQLKESEARYRAIVEDQEELIRRFRPDGTLTFVNRAFCRYFNKTADELLGLNFIHLIPLEDHKTVRQQIALLTPDDPVAHAERRFIGPDGKVRWQHWINRAIFDEIGRVVEYQSVGRDITVQKEAEIKISEAREAIARAARVTTLAIIGGGIAHEINQPLNAIRVLAETGLHLCQAKAEPGKVLQCIRDVSGQVDRIDAIVNHLRSFLRTTQMVEYVPCDLNAVIESSLSYVSNQLFAHHITVRKELLPGLPLVNGSFVRFEEVVLNLVMNAMQALEGKAGQCKEIIIRTWSDEDVYITVSDNGPGIDSAICSRIFEPFFTTKKMGDSMGLGLSIVELIVAACNGSIKVENIDGGGMLVQVSLPAISNV
ncbi:PAS domain S-box protein [Anaerospora hongkongensis]|uniref:PAS domain S-box protein n=1 Tax=Anaerospora hongkongensis TaxID=244830 RepID=UPI002FDB59C0